MKSGSPNTVYHVISTNRNSKISLMGKEYQHNKWTKKYFIAIECNGCNLKYTKMLLFDANANGYADKIKTNAIS